jgi:hypothetical protein
MGVTRLILSLSGLPNPTVKWFSVNAVLWIGVLYYSVRVPRSGFGAYKELFIICALQNLVEQAVVILGIVLAIFSGTNNIFSAPEYSFGANQWLHLGAHLTLGPTFGTLLPWAVGSAALAAVKKGSRIIFREAAGPAAR